MSNRHPMRVFLGAFALVVASGCASAGGEVETDDLAEAVWSALGQMDGARSAPIKRHA